MSVLYTRMGRNTQTFQTDMEKGPRKYSCIQACVVCLGLAQHIRSLTIIVLDSII